MGDWGRGSGRWSALPCGKDGSGSGTSSPHPVARVSGEAAHGLGLAAGVSMGVGWLQPCPQGERKSPRESTPKTPTSLLQLA